MYEVVVLLICLGMVVFFAWQRVNEMQRLTAAASDTPYVCYGSPENEDTHCVHWYDGEPCCWCASLTKTTQPIIVETRAVVSIPKGGIVTPGHLKTTTYVEDPTLFSE